MGKNGTLVDGVSSHATIRFAVTNLSAYERI
jgi:hypothetical protein